MKNLLLFFLLLFVSAGFGQTVLAGKIVDRGSKAVYGSVWVKVFRGNEFVQQTRIDKDGEYFFFLDAGEYDLLVYDFSDVVKRFGDVQVQANRFNFQNAKLERFGTGCRVKREVKSFEIFPKEQTWTEQSFDSKQPKNWFR